MTKLEQVARAVFAAWRKHMDTTGKDITGPRLWEELDDDEKSFALINAKAAIEAMRLPTVEMLDGARDWSVKKYDGRGIGNDAATGCYQSMIDAALKETPK